MNVDNLYGEVAISATAVVGRDCLLGCPREDRVRAMQQGEQNVRRADPLVIGERCLLFNQIIAYEGTLIGDDCVIEDRVRIGYSCLIGPRTRIVHGAYICDRVSVGEAATVAGFVCDGTRIGEGCTVMGDLVHEYTSPHLGWWGVDEEPPVIETESVIGFGAKVIGGVRIGPRSYVAAGAIVSCDVPGSTVVTGINVHTPISEWRGRRLEALIRHWSTPKARNEHGH